MKKKIFIIDDDPGIVEVMTIVLSIEYDVQSVNKFDALFTELQHFHPDLIILDLWLTGIEGKEIYRRLRKTPELAHTPVLMVSAKSNASEVAESLGADAFLAKPFDIHVLTEKVKQLLT